MDMTNREEMAGLADDVRKQALPFTDQATEVFRQLFGAEYHRLRAAALESGEHTAILNVTVRCNFDPHARSIDVQTAPAPSQLKPRRKAVGLPSE